MGEIVGELVGAGVGLKVVAGENADLVQRYGGGLEGGEGGATNTR